MQPSLELQLKDYLSENTTEDPGWIPPLSPNGKGHICDILCNSLEWNPLGGEVIVPPSPEGLPNRLPWNQNLCDSLRRYLRERLPRLRKERTRFHKRREWELRDGFSTPSDDTWWWEPYVPCYTIFDAEIDDIIEWLRTFGQGGSCTVDGLIRACQGAPWFYNFSTCSFRDEPNGTPVRPGEIGGDPTIPEGTWPCLPAVVS